MAKPVEIRPGPQNAREELKRRLDSAPVEHAEAVLNAYRLLDTLHTSGTLDVVRGALGAGDEVLRQAVSLLTTPEAVRATRNLLVLAQMLGSLPPETLHGVAAALPPAMEAAGRASSAEPPSLLQLLKRFLTRDSRRALAVTAGMVETAGRALDPRGRDRQGQPKNPV